MRNEDGSIRVRAATLWKMGSKLCTATDQKICQRRIAEDYYNDDDDGGDGDGKGDGELEHNCN